MPTLIVDDKHKIQIPDDKVGDTDYITKRVDAERQFQDLSGLWEKAQGQYKAWEDQRDQLYPDPAERRALDDDLNGQLNQLRRKINEADSLRRSMDSPLEHNLLTAGSTVMRGAAGTVGLLGDVLNFGGAEKQPEQSAGGTLSDRFQSMGEFPVTQGGKRLGNIAEAAGGGLVSAPRNMTRNTTLGGVAGTGAELTGALLNTDDPILKSLGGLGLAMPAGLVSNLRKATPELARKVKNSASDAEWQAALKSMEQTQAEGMPSVINQHIPRANAVDDLVNALAQRSSGKQVTDVLREQPQILEDRARANLGELQQDTGGNIRGDVTKLASEDKRDLVSYMKGLRRLPTRAAKVASGEAMAKQVNPLVQRAEAATAALRDFNLKYSAELGDLQREPNVIGGAAGAGNYYGKELNTQKRLDMLRAQRQALEQDSMIANAIARDPEALPEPVRETLAYRAESAANARSLENTDTAEALRMIAGMLRRTTSVDGYINLKNQLKEQLTKNQLHVPASEMREKGVIHGLFAQLDAQLGVHGEGHRAAVGAYKATAEALVNPEAKGIVGKMAGKGTKLGEADTGQSFLSVLRKGTVPGAKKSEIITAGRRLEPQTLYDNAATYYNELLNGTGGAIGKVGARSAEDTPARISNTLSSAQGQGLRDVFSIVAEKMEGQGLLTRGQRPNFVRGAEVLKRHADIARIRPNRMQEMSGRELEDVAKADPRVLAAKQAGPLMQYSSPIRQAEMFLSRKAYQTVAEKLTTPEGVKLLLQMGKVRPGSVQAEALLTSFLAGQRESQQ